MSVNALASSNRLQELHVLAGAPTELSLPTEAEVFLKGFEPLTVRLDFIASNCRQLDLLFNEDFLGNEHALQEFIESISFLVEESRKAAQEIESGLEGKTLDTSTSDDSPAPSERIRTGLLRVFRRRLHCEAKAFDVALQSLVGHIRERLLQSVLEESAQALSNEEAQKRVDRRYDECGFGFLQSPFTLKTKAPEGCEMNEHIENLVLKQAQHFTEEMEGMLTMQVQKQWRQRYCTLTADVRRKGEQRYCLRFFEHKRQCKDPRLEQGRAMLGLASIVKLLPNSDKPFTFEVEENGSRMDGVKFVFRASDQRALNRWLNVLSTVTHSDWRNV